MRIRFRSNSSVASVRTNRVSDKCWEYCIVKIREQCTSKKSIRLLPILASESWSTTEINNADFFVKTTCYLFWRDRNLFLLTSETFPTKQTSFSVCWGSISAFTLGACMSKQVEIVQRNDQKRQSTSLTPGKICRAKVTYWVPGSQLLTSSNGALGRHSTSEPAMPPRWRRRPEDLQRKLFRNWARLKRWLKRFWQINSRYYSDV